MSNGDVKTAAQLVSEDAAVALKDYLVRGPARSAGKRQVVAEERQPAPVSRGDRPARHRVRDRPRGHRQDLPGDGAGRGVPAAEEGEPHHPGASGGRSRREARIPARRPAGEGEPVSASAVRRALRHARDRSGGTAARARDGRDRAARVHARPHAQRRVRDSRRGAEHDVRADEDVSHPPRLRLEGGGHRRRDPDRPADGQACRGLSRR